MNLRHIVSSSFAVLLTSAYLCASARAHDGGDKSIAQPLNPSVAGEVVDAEYTLAWVDSEETHFFIPATIDWFYTATLPPAPAPDQWSEDLSGELIAEGVAQEDPTNALVWDTRDVPAGSYWTWSVTYDPPFAEIAASRGVVTVAHDGDPIPPSVVITQPSSPNDVANIRYTIAFAAHDPDGTASVRLEATTSTGGEDLRLVADDLVLGVKGVGTYEWDTRGLEEGLWMIKATIVDARGMRFSAYAQDHLTIEHRLPVGAGSEPIGEAALPDAPTGCSTTLRRQTTGTMSPGIVLLVLFLLARPRGENR